MTGTEPVVPPVDALSLPAQDFLAPGATAPLALTVLATTSSGGLSCLVRYPAGWQRHGRGWYDVDEELLVLSGEVTAGGVTLVAGDYSYRPARLLRPPVTCPAGALVLVVAAGPPTYVLADDEPGGADRTHEVGQRPLSSVPPRSAADGSTRRRLGPATSVLDLPAQWSGRLGGELLVLDGELELGGAVLRRHWYARVPATPGRARRGTQVLHRAAAAQTGGAEARSASAGSGSSASSTPVVPPR